MTLTNPILSLIEKDRILDAVNPPFIGTDLGDWPAVKECFTESLRC